MGVELISQGYYNFTSTPDNCKISTDGSLNLSNISSTCAHTSSHLTTNVLRDDLNDGTPTTSIVIWTGHIMDNNERSTSSLPTSPRQSVVINPWLTSTLNNADDIEREHSFDLMHELTHQLGVWDHYCYSSDNMGVCNNPNCDKCIWGFDDIRQNCIMSYRADLSTLSDAKTYCIDCQVIIQNHLNDHH